jgi:hypothetical protein
MNTITLNELRTILVSITTTTIVSVVSTVEPRL